MLVIKDQNSKRGAYERMGEALSKIIQKFEEAGVPVETTVS